MTRPSEMGIGLYRSKYTIKKGSFLTEANDKITGKILHYDYPKQVTFFYPMFYGCRLLESEIGLWRSHLVLSYKNNVCRRKWTLDLDSACGKTSE